MLDKNFNAKLFDMHTHMDDRVLEISDVAMLCNVSNLKEYKDYLLWKPQRPQDGYSIGVHPWSSDTQCFEELIPYIEGADCVGEIGMDNVWCDIDLEIQEELFRKQLSYAKKNNKTVILHTKGMEEKIAATISEFPNTYIVHWFDDLDCLDLYLNQDCYFTIGPAVLSEESIRNIAFKIPLERVLVESDGLSALEWLTNEKLDKNDYLNLVQKTHQYLADIYHIPIERFKNELQKNVSRVLK